MKKNISLLILAFLAVSCSNTTALEYTDKHFENTLNPDCKEFCTQAKLDIAYFDAGSSVADSINSKTFSFFRDVICLDEQPCDVANYDQLLASFIANYKDLEKDLGQEIVGWEATGDSEVYYQNDKIINIKIEYYIFTGGAHGYSGLMSYIFDLETGKSLNLEDYVTDIEKFTQIAERKFREKFKITADSNINATGFMFDKEYFELPENILFTDNGLTLYYNTYDIAPYVDGPQELKISYKDIQELLKNIN